ncbi:MAG: 4-hydroxythreonine-4-phosphate dehydrogenase PdxA [Candidatus Omnitrophica bacterium]|nr:4-hydroxythreonine-4-phosphate dehydrogenase PdxA [Candidatus Omnitrophota bacterium]
MNKVRVGITMGEPAGIGPEIIAKSLGVAQLHKLAQFCVIGDKWVFNKAQGEKRKAQDEKRKAQSFIDLKNVPHRNFCFGKIKPEYGKAAMDYLKIAVDLIKKRQIDCLVTAPISKESINAAGFKYSGQTEFFAQVFGKKKEDILMFLLNKYLKISLASRHLPLCNVGSYLNKNLVYKAIIATFKTLKLYFAIAQPRICVCALNPHAGEAGLLGKEEIEIIKPAIKKAAQRIGEIIGPLPADTAFSLARQKRFDAVVAMYHDQALVPLKITDFASGVNLTFGLDVVRTSPLHGTAFDIAGANIARTDSFVSALKTAIQCTLNQKRD